MANEFLDTKNHIEKKKKIDPHQGVITVKLQNTKDKQRNLKSSIGKKISYSGQRILPISDFNSNTANRTRALPLKF